MTETSDRKISARIARRFASLTWHLRARKQCADLDASLRDARAQIEQLRNRVKAMEGVQSGLIASLRSESASTRERREVFSQTYSQGLWGSDASGGFFSGAGSRGNVAETYISAMTQELSRIRATFGRPIRVLDLGCGDFHIGAAITRETEDSYIGIDIVPELIDHNQRLFGSARIRFVLADVVEDDLPDADVCLIRQVLQHLSNSDISIILEKTRKYNTVFVTEGAPIEEIGDINPDKSVGDNIRFDWHSGRGRGVELDKPPFSQVLRVVCEDRLKTERIKTYEIIRQAV